MKIWSWRQAIEFSNLPPLTKLLLYTMANYMNEHGDWCFPSVATMAKGCTMDERSVYRHLKNAESAGFIEKRKRQVKGQKWASNEYKAVMPHVQSSIFDDKETIKQNIKNLTGDRESALTESQSRGDSSVNKGVTESQTNSPLELSSEQSNKKINKNEKINLPDWLPLDEWNEYLEMRNTPKRKPTPKALKLAIQKLDNMRKQGIDPAEVLNQSILNSWTGLFPPVKSNTDNKNYKHNNFEGQNYDAGTEGFEVY